MFEHVYVTEGMNKKKSDRPCKKSMALRNVAIEGEREEMFERRQIQARNMDCDLKSAYTVKQQTNYLPVKMWIRM